MSGLFSQISGQGAFANDRINSRVKPHELQPLILRSDDDGAEVIDIIGLPVRPVQFKNKKNEVSGIMSLVDCTDWDAQASKVRSVSATLKNAATGEETPVLVEIKVLKLGYLPGMDPKATGGASNPAIAVPAKQTSDKSAAAAEMSPDEAKALGVTS